MLRTDARGVKGVASLWPVRPGACRRCLLGAGLAALAMTPARAAAPPAGADAGADKPLRIRAAFSAAPAQIHAQLVDLDRPVGEAIEMEGVKIPARVTDKGQLELALFNEKSFSPYRDGQTVGVTLKRDDGKRSQPVKLLLRKRPDGTWTYRNLTVLAVQIETESLIVVDGNGNGTYNEPHVDGLAMAGAAYGFPLPAPAERWCTPEMELTGLSFGPWGEDAKVSGRPLATRFHEALDVLKGVVAERLKLGLTPRPEDPKLSEALQKHCEYMANNSELTHGEDAGKPGHTPEGKAAGGRSILSNGTLPTLVAARMVSTFFHRIDVIRPDTLAFGVGYAGRYGGIDGRTAMLKGKSGQALWPVLCPAPGQTDVPLVYRTESPNATPGDDKAGYPISVQFHTGRLSLTGYKLREAPAAGPVPPSAPSIDCYMLDPKTGASTNMTGFLRCVCIIPKDPLKAKTEYEVTLDVDVDGKPWTRTWRFTTGKEVEAHPPGGRRRH
jgi:hypothetical protein